MGESGGGSSERVALVMDGAVPGYVDWWRWHLRPFEPESEVG
jgi:hypothetical protein